MSLLHAKYIYSIPTAPKDLWCSSINSKVQSLIYLSKSDMGETQVTIHPEAKFLSSCERVKLDKLCNSKIQW